MSLFETKTEKVQLEIIKDLSEIINKLVNPQRASFLKATYITLDHSGQPVFSNSKNNKMAAQTITITSLQTSVPGQIVPVASDGVTTEPISSINPGSEVYTISDPTIATAAPTPGGTEGQFTVTRVPGASGSVTLTYSAVTVGGATITNFGGVPDTFIFQGTATGVPTALVATYGTPS